MSSSFPLPIEEMRLLDFVTWDRYAGTPDDFGLFGWISRADGRSDFIRLHVVPDGIGYSTSSAEYSAEISTRLNGGEPTGTHNDCLRVEAHPDAASLPNVVRLERGCVLPAPSADHPLRRFDAAALRLHYETVGQVIASLSEMGTDPDVASAVSHLGVTEAIESAASEERGDALGKAFTLLERVGTQDPEVREFLAGFGLEVDRRG
jgi:hypothetical protein